MTSLPPDEPVLPEPEGPANDPLTPIVPPMVDPLARTLDALEASIEQQPRVGDWFTQDPLSKTLSRLEQSVDGRQPPPPEGWERFLAIFDHIDERGPRPTPAGREPRPSESPSELRRDGPAYDAAGPGAVRPVPLATPHFDPRKQFMPGEHAQPTYHAMGGGAGIRGGGPEPKGYCHLREEWVREDDCASCSDFETAESTTEGEPEDRCRHLHADPVDEEERDTDSDTEGDE
jgi:hypothetical protein